MYRLFIGDYKFLIVLKQSSYEAANNSSKISSKNTLIRSRPLLELPPHICCPRSPTSEHNKDCQLSPFKCFVLGLAWHATGASTVTGQYLTPGASLLLGGSILLFISRNAQCDELSSHSQWESHIILRCCRQKR